MTFFKKNVAIISSGLLLIDPTGCPGKFWNGYQTSEKVKRIFSEFLESLFDIDLKLNLVFSSFT